MIIGAYSGESARALAQSFADIHASAFAPSGTRPWTVREMQELAGRDTAVFFAAPDGFLVIDVIADEAELLTLAVIPEIQGQGRGRALVDEMKAYCARRGVRRVYLEVASDNHAAITLYCGAGFQKVGLRKDYFLREFARIDALIMEVLLFKS